MITRTWRVYGRKGHRQAQSFNDSFGFKCNNGYVSVLNRDITRSNKFSIIQITTNSYEECHNELIMQLYNGAFKNCCVGGVVEV